MSVAKLKLQLNQAGLGSVFLNDMDLGGCITAIAFKSKAGSLTEVMLTLSADVEAEVVTRLEQIALAKIEQEPPKLDRPNFVPLKSRQT